MVDGQLFDTLAALAMELRKKPDRPFGGIQVSTLSQSVVNSKVLLNVVRTAGHYRRLLPTPTRHALRKRSMLRLSKRSMEDQHRAYHHSHTSFPTKR